MFKTIVVVDRYSIEEARQTFEKIDVIPQVGQAIKIKGMISHDFVTHVYLDYEDKIIKVHTR